jgi:peptidoglycan/xylan/chitin deacetylase (PgdA/CDA1 family)
LALLLTLSVVSAGCSATPGRAQTLPTHSAQPVPTPAGGSGPSGPVTPSQPAGPGANPFTGRVPDFPAPPTPAPVSLHGGAQAPFFSRVPTSQPVAFLTMDDGWSQAPAEIQLMQAAHIRFMMFLLSPVAAHDPDFFRQLVQAGGVVGDHTVNHTDLRGASYTRQHDQICPAATSLTGVFGVRPTLFRPPFGSYDSTTLRAAHDCGLTAVVNWSETVDKGIVRYQTAEHRIKPGDIILMHFRPAFVDDVLAALNAIKAAGLTPALLTDYLVAPAA